MDEKALDHLGTYLNDHLAGSVVALDLLERLEASHDDPKLKRFFRQLHGDVAADRETLEKLMAGLNLDESKMRKASGWLSEKFTELKLRFDDPRGGSLRLFEALELLSLGIEGKRTLWLTLAALAPSSPVLQILNYEQLAERAQKQRDRIEDLRIEIAQKAIAPKQSD
jgi:hypothetical protein